MASHTLDRFAVVETAYVVACDYGLYGVVDHIRKDHGLRPRPSLRAATLSYEQWNLYQRLVPSCRTHQGRMGQEDGKMSWDLEEIRQDDGDLPRFAWPGGYPITYVCADGGSLCAACANGGNGSEASTDRDAPDDWRMVGYQVEEDPADEIRCDHCGTIIQFGED